MSIKALGIISANYEGKGFSQLTLKRTDATIPFGGRYRLIDFALSNMVNSGITTVGLITPYYYRSIMDHVGVGKPWGLARKIGGLFVLPGSVLGERSAGSKAILKDLIRNRRILDSCEADYVVITASSTIMNIDYQPFIEAHEKDGNTVSVLYKKEAGDEQGIYFKEDKKTG
ncbi:MAG: glucose-1-phosphate adenylyltransferase subunit GlgD, partial [Firmicutes bacterium]|nr:glucose-1-phosphate adenylyltransferase subunit GlgD [Bacillota bacterium]